MSWREAVSVSRALDDGRGTLDASQAGQARVDAALGAGVTWEAAPGVRSRVMARVSQRALVQRSSGRVWGRLAGAACICVAGGAAWFALHPAPRVEFVAQHPQSPAAPAAPQPAGLNLAAMFQLPAKSDPAIAASVEEPLLREAKLIREDSKAGMEMVLSRLPIGDVFGQ